jgi:hypothetical protein
MSAKEKRQLLTVLIVWLVIGALGFGYFWSQNPERKLNAVISSSQASKVAQELDAYFREDTLNALNGGASAQDLPEKFADTTLTEAARESWPLVVDQASTKLKNSRYWREEYPELQFTERYRRNDAYGSMGIPVPTFDAQGNVEVGSCVEIIATLTFPASQEVPADAQYYTDSEQWLSTCVTAVVDKDSGEIVKFRNADYLDW